MAALRRAVDTVVIRHPLENLAKCSLTPLESRADTRSWLRFLMADSAFSFDAQGYTELAVDAPPLSPADADRPILLLDATWRLLPKVRAQVTGVTIPRSIPHGWQTAYPRVSKDGSDPSAGLASVEALFVAQAVMGWTDPNLLEAYYWAESFRALNAHLMP